MKILREQRKELHLFEKEILNVNAPFNIFASFRIFSFQQNLMLFIGLMNK